MKQYAFVILLCSGAASAACLNGHPTIKQEYASSKYVLIGKVVSDHKTAAAAESKGNDFLDGDAYQVDSTRTFKGQPNNPTEIFSENSSGRFPMQMKASYLVFLYEDSGRLMVDNCGNSGLVSHARKTILEVTALSR
jgi:hypothetical protein